MSNIRDKYCKLFSLPGDASGGQLGDIYDNHYARASANRFEGGFIDVRQWVSYPYAYHFAELECMVNNFNFRSENMVVVVPTNEFEESAFKVLTNKKEAELFLLKYLEYAYDKFRKRLKIAGVFIVGLKKTHDIFKSNNLGGLSFIAFGVGLYSIAFHETNLMSGKSIPIWNDEYCQITNWVSEHWNLNYNRDFSVENVVRKFNYTRDFTCNFILDILHSQTGKDINVSVQIGSRNGKIYSDSFLLKGNESNSTKYMQALNVLKTVLSLSSFTTITYKLS